MVVARHARARVVVGGAAVVEAGAVVPREWRSVIGRTVQGRRICVVLPATRDQTVTMSCREALMDQMLMPAGFIEYRAP